LPNKRIEVSAMYYDMKYRNAGPGATLDLTFARILKELNLPELPAHDAFNDALSVAMMYLQLTDLAARGAGLAVERPAQEMRRLHMQAMG
jgi:DNA polymerase-3 subunit epsilon